MSPIVSRTRRFATLASAALVALTACDTTFTEPITDNPDALTASLPVATVPRTPSFGFQEVSPVLIYQNEYMLSLGRTTDCVWLEGRFIYTWSDIPDGVTVYLQSRPRGGTEPDQTTVVGTEYATFYGWRGGWQGQAMAELPNLDPNRQYRLRVVQQTSIDPIRHAYSDWFRRADSYRLLDGTGYIEYCSAW